jgi:phospholipase C
VAEPQIVPPEPSSFGAADVIRLSVPILKEKNSMHSCVTKALATVAVAAITLLPVVPVFGADQDDFPTRTPIKHVVVIFQENSSFDHYFGTYPPR